MNSRHEAHESRHWAYCHTLAANGPLPPSEDPGTFEAFCFYDAIEKLLANLITTRTITAWQNNDSTNSGFAFFRSSFKDVFRDAFLLRPIDLTRNLRDENKGVFGRFFLDAFKV